MDGHSHYWADVAKALLHPELELVLSLGFLASLANQPFQDSPQILHLVEFGDMWRVLLLVAHTVWRARQTRLELEVRNEQLQGLARTEFGVFQILHQWGSPGKLLITSNFEASFLTGTPTRSHNCRRSLLLAETGSLTTFFPGFLASFLTFLHTLTLSFQRSVYTFSWDTQTNKVFNNRTVYQIRVWLSTKIQWSSSSLPG